jgi:hypothetical protein
MSQDAIEDDYELIHNTTCSSMSTRQHENIFLRPLLPSGYY